jgi:hypothetical protein
MNIPIISASNPTVVPSKTYDKWWVKSLLIQGPNPNSDIDAHVVLGKFLTNGDGVAELSEETEVIDLEGLLILSQTDADLASVVSGILTYINKICVEKGIAQNLNG